MQLLEGVAEQRIILAAEGIEAGEDQALGFLVPGHRFGGGTARARDGVADLCVADALEAGGHVAHLAGRERADRHEPGPEHAKLEDLGLRARGHQPHLFVLVKGPGCKADVDHDALVGIVVGVEDQSLEAILRVPPGSRDACHDGLQDVGHAGALLGRGEDHLLARNREDVLQLLQHELRLGRREVDLVQHGDDREPFP